MNDNESIDIELTQEEQKILKKKKSDEKWSRLGYWFGSGGSTPEKEAAKRQTRTVERTKNEYVFFGSFPQTVKPKNVGIKYSAGNGLYTGSDGKTYCKKEYRRIKEYDKDKTICEGDGSFNYAVCRNEKNVSAISRYSDGQDSAEPYFRVEPIKWYVINRKDGILTLLSDKILFYANYSVLRDSFLNTVFRTKESWGASDIRATLNNMFYNTAFSPSERAGIVPANLKTDNSRLGLNILEKAFTDSDTTDSVFLLSTDECKQYCLNSADLSKSQTDFCGKCLGYKDGSLKIYYCNWITRTISNTNISNTNNSTYRGSITVLADYITYNGRVWKNMQDWCPDYNEFGIVPVICVKESAVTVFGNDEQTDYNGQCDSGNTSSTGCVKESTQLSQPSFNSGTAHAVKLKHRIIYTVVAPICWFLGMIIASGITGGGASSNFGGFCTLAYLVFSEVMIWKIKDKLGLLKILAFLNIVISFGCWLLFGIY